MFCSASLTFQCFMSNPTLSLDVVAMMRIGNLQTRCVDEGCDTPAGWFRAAVEAYWGDDPEGRLGQQACTLVAEQFERGTPQ